MKKFFYESVILFVLLVVSGCTASVFIKGTYVTITPLAGRGFNSDEYETICFAYAPVSEKGRLFKKELTDALKSAHYVIPPEKDEIDATLKTGRDFSGEVTIDDARTLGRIMKVKAVIIVKSAVFTPEGTVDKVELVFVDPFGGVLVRILFI